MRIMPRIVHRSLLQIHRFSYRNIHPFIFIQAQKRLAISCGVHTKGTQEQSVERREENNNIDQQQRKSKKKEKDEK